MADSQALQEARDQKELLAQKERELTYASDMAKTLGSDEWLTKAKRVKDELVEAEVGLRYFQRRAIERNQDLLNQEETMTEEPYQGIAVQNEAAARIKQLKRDRAQAVNRSWTQEAERLQQLISDESATLTQMVSTYEADTYAAQKQLRDDRRSIQLEKESAELQVAQSERLRKLRAREAHFKQQGLSDPRFNG